jgi:hypothetical protein
MPSGHPTPCQPKGRLGVSRPWGVFGVLSYYKLIILFLNIVRLIVEFTSAFKDAEEGPVVAFVVCSGLLLLLLLNQLLSKDLSFEFRPILVKNGAEAKMSSSVDGALSESCEVLWGRER